jgi:hypothetical protein
VSAGPAGEPRHSLKTKLLTPTGAARWGVSVMISLAGVGIAIGLAIGYTIKENNRQDRELCKVIVYIDDRNQRLPNPTPEQREAFDVLHGYRQALHCPARPIARALK